MIFIINAFFILGLAFYGYHLYKCIKAQEKAFTGLSPNPDKMMTLAAPRLNQLRMNQDSNYNSSSSKSSLSNVVTTVKKRAKSTVGNRSPVEEPSDFTEDIPAEQPMFQKLHSCPPKSKHIHFKKISQPIILEESLQAEMDQKIQDLEEENRQGFVFQDHDDILQTKKQIRKIEKVREDLEFREPVIPEPKLTRAVTFYGSGADFLKEKRIRDIVNRDQYYFKPVVKKQIDEELDVDASIIITDTEGFVWDVPDEEEDHERQIQASITEEEEKDELRRGVERLKKKTIFQKYADNDKTLHESSSLSELYIKRLMDDPEYIRHHQQVIKNDEAVIKRIVGQTAAAIIVGIVSALLNLIVYISTILSSSIGVLLFVWFNGIMTVFSVVAILALFTLVKSQEKENLRLISRIGKTKNRISTFYAFVLPNYLRQDESKKDLERYINYVTTGNPDFLPHPHYLQ